ncbi:MAG: ABC transporter ATP-binding protein [Oscillospiraceae bacterium]|nr:ABC transporter ATP-binding protein [Oscillospiraceae bacterium]
MWKRLLKYRWYLIVLVALMILTPTMDSVLNFWLQKLFNMAEPGGDRVQLLRVLTGGFLLWMVKRVLNISMDTIKPRYICSLKQDIKHSMFVSLMGLGDADLTSIASSGEYISSFTNDITLIETRFFNQIFGLIGAFFSLTILGSSFLALNKVIALPILCFGLLTMALPAFFSKILNQKNLEWSNKISRFTQKIKEFMTAYPTIKNYAIEREISQRFDEINTETEDAKFEADFALNLANSIGVLLSWFMQLIAVGIGLVLAVKGEVKLGTVIAGQAFAAGLAEPFQNIIINWNSIRSVRNIVKKLERMTGGDLPAPEPLPEELSQRLTGERCDVSFRGFSLSLGQKKIIDDFSFEFETGKKYLVVGLNGSGKSTLFKALKKWYHVDGGSICINDVDISQIPSSALSPLISYLNETVSLFSGTVRENIDLYRPNDPATFREALAAAHVELDVERELADEGRNISSGERRRIEIARSLIRSVRVMIFDEVVSTLDIETAYEIERLALGFRDKTVIFISHNFSGKLIEQYDEILVMGEGKLIAHGSFRELMDSCPYFQRICELKFGGKYGGA